MGGFGGGGEDEHVFRIIKSPDHQQKKRCSGGITQEN